MNKFCREPYKCLNVEMRDSKIAVSTCCAMPSWEVDEIDFINDPSLNEVRSIWAKNQWPKGCQTCKRAELNDLRSRRQNIEEWFLENHIVDDEIKLVRLDFWCGNLCNLRCAICGPHYSSAWQKELGIEKKDREIFFNNNAFKKLDLSNLKWIHFNGGEPLLIDTHIDFLGSLDNLNQIVINYNTNGTVLPKDRLIKIWERAKLVQLDFSIDDINERFEYQRYPAKWETIVKNLEWFYNNMPVNVMFEINATVSILNNSRIEIVKNWFDQNFRSNRVTDPVTFRTQLAGGTLSLSADRQKALEYLEQLDARRKTSWKEIFPELIDYFSGELISSKNLSYS